MYPTYQISAEPWLYCMLKDVFQAAFYLEQCKPLLAWKYIVVAAQMCLTLGYHRKRPVAFETHEQKRRRIRLVWFAVMIDKILSLRLGRHSTFREGDLALERFQDADASVTMLPATPKYVEWSLHQGRIYEQVFSPDALKEPESVRVERARALAVQLQAIFDTMDRGEVYGLSLSCPVLSLCTSTG